MDLPQLRCEIDFLFEGNPGADMVCLTENIKVPGTNGVREECPGEWEFTGVLPDGRRAGHGRGRKVEKDTIEEEEHV